MSLAVGLALWPRGAGAALGRALSAAYADSVSYLTSAVAYGLGRCDSGGPAPGPPVEQAAQAAAAARRLDDTFRGYLAERGAKPVPMAEVTALVTGVVGAPAGDAAQLWDGDAATGRPRRGPARAVGPDMVRAGGALPRAWSARARFPAAEPRRRRRRDASSTPSAKICAIGTQRQRTAVRVIWTGDHLDAVRRLQSRRSGPRRRSPGGSRLSALGPLPITTPSIHHPPEMASHADARRRRGRPPSRRRLGQPARRLPAPRTSSRNAGSSKHPRVSGVSRRSARPR